MNYRFKINNNFYLIFILVGLPISVLLKDYNLSIFPDFNLELVKIYRLLLVLFTIYFFTKLENTFNYYVLLLLIINLVFLYNQFLGSELIFSENLSTFLEKNTDLQNIEYQKINFAITKNKYLIINIFNIILPLIMLSFKKFSINIRNFNITIIKILKIYLLFFIILFIIKFFTLNYSLVGPIETFSIYKKIDILFTNFILAYKLDFRGFFINQHLIHLPLSLFIILSLQKYFIENKKNNLSYIILIFIILLLTKAYLMLFISIIIGTIISIPHIKKKKLLCLIILGVLFLLFTFFYFQISDTTTGSILGSLIIRFKIIYFYIFNIINPNYLIGNNLLNSNLYTYPHNFIIDLYICTGVVGGSIFLIISNNIYNSFKFFSLNNSYLNIILFQSLFISFLSGFFFTNIAFNVMIALFLINFGESD